MFATCQQSIRSTPSIYLQDIAEIGRWSDEVGCEGILIYTDNGLVDPLARRPNRHREHGDPFPLVAVQPVYMHPYAAAKMAATLGFLYQRRIWLNLVAGGFRLDLQALADETPHHERYTTASSRCSGQIVKALLAGQEPLSFSGDYYTVRNLRMSPSLPAELFPGFTVSVPHQ